MAIVGNAYGKLIQIKDRQGEAYLFHCPGCDMDHIIPVSYADEHANQLKKVKPTWRFNGSLEKPTFHPEFRIEWKGAEPPQVCHVVIRDGELIYLVESTHKLSGLRLKMEDVE